MKKYMTIIAMFSAAMVFSASVLAQKTATSIVKQVLRMNGVGGQFLGYELLVVVPDLIQGGTLRVIPADIGEKNIGRPLNVKVKYFNDIRIPSSTLKDAKLSLSEPGINGIAVSLGTLTFYPSNPAGSEVKISLPSTLSVLQPSSTVPGGTIHGKASCTIRYSDGTTSTFDRVIYFRARLFEIDG